MTKYTLAGLAAACLVAVTIPCYADSSDAALRARLIAFQYNLKHPLNPQTIPLRPKHPYYGPEKVEIVCRYNKTTGNSDDCKQKY